MKTLSWFLVLIGFITNVIAQDKPVRPDKLFTDAETAFDEGNYRRTIQLLDACLQESPGYTDAYFMRGCARDQMKELEAALIDYSVFLERRPEHREALLNRAIVRYKLKKYDQAREDFKQLLVMPPGSTQSIYFNRNASAQGVNQIMTAQSSMTPLICNYLGMIDYRQQHFKESIHWLDSAIQLQGKEADYFVNRALAKQGLGDSVAALQDYKKALALDPRHSLALTNATLLGRVSKDAIDEDPLTLAIEGDSTMLAPYLQRARQRMEGGFFKGANDDLTKALEIEDRDPEIWFTRGLVRERLQDLKGAFSDYTQAITLQEGHFKSWINRANVLLKMKRYQDAVDDYTVALVYRADYADAYYNRAVAKHYLGQQAASCEDIDKAASLGMKVDAKVKKLFCGK